MPAWMRLSTGIKPVALSAGACYHRPVDYRTSALRGLFALVALALLSSCVSGGESVPLDTPTPMPTVTPVSVATPALTTTITPTPTATVTPTPPPTPPVPAWVCHERYGYIQTLLQDRPRAAFGPRGQNVRDALSLGALDLLERYIDANNTALGVSIPTTFPLESDEIYAIQTVIDAGSIALDVKKPESITFFRNMMQSIDPHIMAFDILAAILDVLDNRDTGFIESTREAWIAGEKMLDDIDMYTSIDVNGIYAWLPGPDELLDPQIAAPLEQNDPDVYRMIRNAQVTLWGLHRLEDLGLLDAAKDLEKAIEYMQRVYGRMLDYNEECAVYWVCHDENGAPLDACTIRSP